MNVNDLSNTSQEISIQNIHNLIELVTKIYFL
jgi:hypothetical protein